MHRSHCLRLLIVACGGLAGAVPSERPQPQPPPPTKSLPPGSPDSTWREPLPGGGFKTIRRGLIPVERSFEAAGIATVVLRAAEAEDAEVVTGPVGSPILVAGLPEGNEVGYHPADPTQERVASPYGRGLDFAARPYGRTLVVSSAREVRYIHHDFLLVRLRVTVPPGVAVVKQGRPVLGNPAASTTHLEAP